MNRGRSATYSLVAVQDAVRRRAYWIMWSASRGAAALGLDEVDITDCVLRLSARDFHKTMPSERTPGLFQDVYRCRHHGLPMYVKIQLGFDGRAVVVSFIRDESA